MNEYIAKMAAYNRVDASVMREVLLQQNAVSSVSELQQKADTVGIIESKQFGWSQGFQDTMYQGVRFDLGAQQSNDHFEEFYKTFLFSNPQACGMGFNPGNGEPDYHRMVAAAGRMAFGGLEAYGGANLAVGSGFLGAISLGSSTPISGLGITGGILAFAHGIAEMGTAGKEMYNAYIGGMRVGTPFQELTSYFGGSEDAQRYAGYGDGVASLLGGGTGVFKLGSTVMKGVPLAKVSVEGITGSALIGGSSSGAVSLISGQGDPMSDFLKGAKVGVFMSPFGGLNLGPFGIASKVEKFGELSINSSQVLLRMSASGGSMFAFDVANQYAGGTEFGNIRWDKAAFSAGLSTTGTWLKEMSSVNMQANTQWWNSQGPVTQWAVTSGITKMATWGPSVGISTSYKLH